MSGQFICDADLWSQSLGGDERAFAEIFDRHKDRIFRHALAVSESRAEADDLTGITFFELWRHRGKIQLVDGSILPWLLTTATHVARNAARKRRRYALMFSTLPHEGEEPESAEDAAIRSLPLEATSAPLASALRALPEKDEQLMLLVAVEGLTVAAAARVLGIKPDAARTRLMRARKRLAHSPFLSTLPANATL